jgi:hypothetical protein
VQKSLRASDASERGRGEENKVDFPDFLITLDAKYYSVASIPLSATIATREQARARPPNDIAFEFDLPQSRA